jgi:hypothetical protein
MTPIRAVFLAVGLALGSLATAAGAAVFTVDTTADDPSLTGCDDATPNDCSLRGAIIKANGLAETSTINIPAGTYVLTPSAIGAPCHYPFTGAPTPTLCLTGSISLVGQGADMTIIDANQPTGNIGVGAPVLFVGIGATVRLSALTLKRGNFSGGMSGGVGGDLGGGGIDNGGTLIAEDCVVSDNFTAGYGGGIYNHGDLTLLRSVVTRNTSAAGAAASSTRPAPVASLLLARNRAAS